MAFKFVAFAAFVAVARAGHLAHSYSAPALFGSHDSISTYSTVQQHAPAVHLYAAHTPALHAYAAHAPALHSYAAHAPVVHASVAHGYSAPFAHGYAAPVAHGYISEHSAPANYDFGYAVSDPHTGDAKSQHESRHGDVVHGSYSLLESDGTKRVVDYTADPHHGFNAVVHNEPAAVAIKTVAPVVAKYVKPVSYAAPVAHAYAASPVAHAYSAGPVSHEYSTSVGHGYAASPVAHYSAGPVAHYSAGPVAHGYSSSVGHGYAAPYSHGLASPYVHGHSHGYAAQAPVLSHNVW